MAIYEELMGNPFVDAGVSAICEYLSSYDQIKEANEITISDLDSIIKDLYLVFCSSAWSKNLYSIFPNNAVTNPANRKKDFQALLRSCWNELLNTVNELGEFGDCAGCGRRSANVYLTKTDIPLTGSGELLNFFPIFSPGVGYCSACALAIQFAPLSFVASGGKFLMVHSNCWKWQRVWARECIRAIKSQILRKEITGCYNPGLANGRNSFFKMTDELMRRYNERWSRENATIQVYYFTNYNQGPELDIYSLPTGAFRFLAYVHEKNYSSEWNKIVRKGYQKVNWDKIKSDDEDEYKNKSNLVYEWLLEGKSILSFFLNRPERQVRGNWDLVTLYLKEVHVMSESRLVTIKRVADSIACSIKKSGNVKRLGQMERSVRYAEFRNVLLRIIRDRIDQGKEDPLFSIDEYMTELFPETDGEFMDWRETRDLLLFRIYETLHGWLKDQKDLPKIDEPEEGTEE